MRKSKGNMILYGSSLFMIGLTNIKFLSKSQLNLPRDELSRWSYLTIDSAQAFIQDKPTFDIHSLFLF
jgi:hypothetical protein